MPHEDSVPALLTRARVATQRRDTLQAAVLYQQVLDRDAGQLEAVEFLSGLAAAGGQTERAIRLLESASTLHPQDGELARALGVACLGAGDGHRARNHLERACQVNARDYTARLPLGLLCERQNDHYGALTNYFGALTAAQSVGEWVDAATTPTDLAAHVLHAAAYVRKHRGAFFSEKFRPLEARYGASTLKRIRQGLWFYLNEVEIDYADARQRPLFLYVPDLPPTPFYPPARFEWIPALQSRTAEIRRELTEVLARDAGLEPFHGSRDPADLANYLRGSRGTPAWDTYFFFRHGAPFETNAVRCPHTMAALDAVPLARIREHAPEVLFSILRPGTHILPHRGVTNTRVVAHLPLVVPEDCAIVVGGETHVWKEGEVVVFDDTFEHEAWNRSGETRAILLLDLWNPDLEPAECAALAELVPAIGDFNRDCGIG